MKNLDNVVISEGMNIVTIIVGNKIIDNDLLIWKNEDYGNERSITLGSLYNQMKIMCAYPVIYVWEESPLVGIIYMCGNHKEGKWIEHGTTKGYA